MNDKKYIQLLDQCRSKILSFSDKKKSCKFGTYYTVAQLDKYGNSPLHIACIFGNDKVIVELLSLAKKHHDPNQLLKKNQDGWIPIALSIIHNNVKCFRLLFNHTLTACNFRNISKHFQGFSIITLAVVS